ncbi:MAG: FecR domain-containing protein [Anaerolineae bacterium]|nr:FecR domain-containing protein [Anaerolineae bacterium]
MNELTFSAAVRRGTQTQPMSEAKQAKIQARMRDLLQNQRQRGPVVQAVESAATTMAHLIEAAGEFLLAPASADNSPELLLKPFRAFARAHVRQGNIELNRRQNRFDVPKDMFLAAYAGDELWTRDNQIQMQCFLGQLVEVRPQTRVLLAQLARQGEQTNVELQLLMGQLNAKITRRLTAADAFVIQTPSARISTQGGECSVQVLSPRQTHCEVMQGAMTVVSDGARVQVDAGQALNVISGEPLRPTALAVIQHGLIYLAQPGDFVAHLARRFNCNLNLLRLANPHVSGEILIPGSMLLIPKS